MQIFGKMIIFFISTSASFPLAGDPGIASNLAGFRLIIFQKLPEFKK